MQVRGRAYFEHGHAAARVTLHFYHIGFGGAATAVGEVVTEPDGSFTAGLAFRSVPVNLEIRAGDIVLTHVIYGAEGRDEPLTIVVPASVRPLTGEFQRITEDTGRYLGDARLRQAREDDGVRDLTLLNRATRWDARLIATAAHADTLAETTGIDSQALYGMLRAGLPSNPLRLARVSPAAAGKALEKANEAGIVSLSKEQVEAAQAAIAGFAKATRRDLVGGASQSSYGELLTATGLDQRDQDRFDEIFAAHTGDVSELWEKAEQAELPVPRLQTTARLGYLTLNNAALIADLMPAVERPEAIGEVLVGQGLYEADRWVERITRIAADIDDERTIALARPTTDKSALEKLIPPPFDGLDAYAADLARKVRLSYPTQVIAHRVKTGQLALEAGNDVSTVLNRATGLGFSLGRTPLNRFLAEHGETVLAGTDSERTVASVKTLQRLYQATPTDEALKVLLDNGFKSAHDVTAMAYEKFVDRYGSLFPSQAQAKLTYRKAQQITTVTYTFVGAVKQMATAPTIPVVSPPSEVVEETKNKLIKQFPTLESLFGSLDFCECDHCRSVLGPAAYLVDILKFLDPKQELWAAELADWKSRHGGAAYPFPDTASWVAAGKPAPGTPYEVLKQRRPDIARLPLTCENTNTALPYLDIVNEIMECYVVEQSLDLMPVYDAGLASSADLLAEPANLMPAAYDVLAGAKYPLTLPFDLWWETVRGFCDHFEAPLWTLLAALRPSDPDAVLMERLGIPAAELAILTDANPLAGWPELYGYDPATVTEQQALDTLRSARELARRLRVTYHELTAIVRTAFVNPHLHTLATLRKLDITIEDALRYRGVSVPFTPAEKASFETKLGSEGKAWLQAVDLAGFSQILVLADPTTACGFDATRLRHADGAEAGPVVFVRLNHFVRIWRRLGWPVEEIDAALATFGPDPAAALIGVARYDALAATLKVAKKSRTQLLRLWSDLDDLTYTGLFLTGSAQTRDPAFDHPLGDYLSDGTVLLSDHLATVQAALRLTADDVSRILVDAGTADPATAPLTMPIVSTLYRYSLLAKLLKLPIVDLIALKGLSGVTDPVDLADVAAVVKGSGLVISELEYLLRHHFDPMGPHRAAATPPFGLIRTLAVEIQRVRAGHAVPADALAFTDEVVRQELSLGLPADVTETFLRMWTGTAEYRAVLAVPPGDQLEPLDGFVVGYDAVRQEQHLVYQGILSDAKRALVPMSGQPAYLSQLLDDIQRQPRDFFELHLLGFLQPSDFDTLFPDALTQQAQIARRQLLASRYLPFLQGRLIRALVIATVATELGAEPAMVGSLIDGPAYTAIADGLTGLDGYVEVPETGAYRFFLSSADPAAELRFDHLNDPAIPAGQTEAHVELRAGVPYGFTVHANVPASLLVQGEQLAKGSLDRLTGYTRSDVDGLHRAHLLLSKAVMLALELGLDHAELRRFDLSGLPVSASDATDPLPLFAIFLRMAAYTSLRERLGAQPSDMVDLFASTQRMFPANTATTDAGEETLAGFCERFAKLTRRTTETVREAADLLGITAAATPGGDPYPVTVPQLVGEQGIRRLFDVLALAAKLGVSPIALGRWATREPDITVARDLRDTVKARYEPDTWRRVVQPIADALRRKRRDALVAHIMHAAGFDRLEQLFEFFLVDPGTEPVVQTSRLRLAISSVQMFIQRCLLNVEPRVHPSVINAAHWQWMKRYRVWEANRKIFLWPENWLEPEFRDDKTHLFAELESTLMQTDISNDDAEDALYGYLRGLDELARLDIRSVFVQEKVDPADNIVHVLGRTFQAPHRYFYRRYEHRMWTPWLPVEAEIESDHVVVTVWRDRVHVLWASLMEEAYKPEPDNKNESIAAMSVGETTGMEPTIKVKAQLTWVEYFQGQWSPPNSSGYMRPKQPGWDLPNGYYVYFKEQTGSVDPAEVMVHVTAEDDGSVWLHLTGAFQMAFRLISRNSPPTRQFTSNPLEPPYPTAAAAGRGRYTGDGSLSVRYVEKITTKGGKTTTSCPKTHTILGKGSEYALVTHARELDGMPSDVGKLVLPFFYADEHHTFYVEPRLTEKTIEQSDGFVLADSLLDLQFDDDRFWKEIEVVEHIPIGPPPVERVSPVAKFALTTPVDWVTRAGTHLEYGDGLIGPTGGLAQKGQS